MNMQPEKEDSPEVAAFREETSPLEVMEEPSTHINSGQNNMGPPRHRPFNLKRLFVITGIIGVVILLLGGGIYLVRRSLPRPQSTVVINTQSLDNGTLNKLTDSNGAPSKQQLTISPDTLFQNSAEISKDLIVKGQTSLQSPVTITKSLTVGGSIATGGNLTVTGQITASSLNVGSVTLTTLRLSGDLELEGHIISTGPKPSIITAIAARGGTANIDGSDTTGTITIQTGSATGIAGEMAIITFKSRYGSTPRVQITPVNGSASKMDYFVIKTPGFFTIETSSVADPNSIYSFDYLVTQ